MLLVQKRKFNQLILGCRTMIHVRDPFFFNYPAASRTFVVLMIVAVISATQEVIVTVEAAVMTEDIYVKDNKM